MEGAFLGWHLTTPTFWMWSFRLKKAVRLEGPKFSSHLYPFHNPEILVNPTLLTKQMVEQMHAAAGPVDTLFTNDKQCPMDLDEPTPSGMLSRSGQPSSLLYHNHPGEPTTSGEQRAAAHHPVSDEGERRTRSSSEKVNGTAVTEAMHYRWTNGKQVPQL